MTKNNWAKGRKENAIVRIDKEAHEKAKSLAKVAQESLRQWLSNLIYQQDKIITKINLENENEK